MEIVAPSGERGLKLTVYLLTLIYICRSLRGARIETKSGQICRTSQVVAPSGERGLKRKDLDLLLCMNLSLPQGSAD